MGSSPCATPVHPRGQPLSELFYISDNLVALIYDKGHIVRKLRKCSKTISRSRGAHPGLAGSRQK